MITASICPECYEEIPALLSIDGNAILLSKAHCGKEWVAVAEPDVDFCRQAEASRGDVWSNLSSCLVEITHRCNNKCPNCYHSEDRGGTEPTPLEIIARVQAIPVGMICLIGGEPTVRDDLPELISNLVAIGRCPVMYTNGIKLADREYARSLKDAGLQGIAFSLHHPEYSHPRVLDKKRDALEVLRDENMFVEHLAFSLDNEGQIPGILDEIERYRDYAMSFRIRSGYQPKDQKWFVSDLHKLVKAEADHRGKVLRFYTGADNTRYQVGFEYDGIKVWLMSWPSDITIDLAHARGFPQAAFFPGAVQHFCRAVVTQEGLRKGWFNGKRIGDK
jgi:MoaA/NifB/PqqE/SkfB family radical SAM enzyme